MRESIHRSPPEQRRLDEAADDDRASARPHTAAAVLAAQSGAGNQAVARALAGRRTLSRWREFDGARGDAQYDYKIVNGNHATAGRYHISSENHACTAATSRSAISSSCSRVSHFLPIVKPSWSGSSSSCS